MKLRKVVIIGTGYVGLVTGTCLADLGHRVTCMDIDESRIAGLRRGVMPIYEPGLAALVEKNAAAERLDFSTDFAGAVRGRDVLFVAVGTPAGADGRADLSQVEAIGKSLGALREPGELGREPGELGRETKELARETKEPGELGRETGLPRYVVVKSTVPVGTCRRLQGILEGSGNDNGPEIEGGRGRGREGKSSSGDGSESGNGGRNGSQVGSENGRGESGSERARETKGGIRNVSGSEIEKRSEAAPRTTPWELAREMPQATSQSVPQTVSREVPRVVSCPEFLREGSAVHDFFHPDRIVVGAEREEDARDVAGLFEPVPAPRVLTDLESAEMIKYASNAFLATKISFINEIAAICERTGADVKEVARGMGLDTRIGEKFLHAGLGYGGSCFPKDTLALIAQAADRGYDFRILQAVTGVNAGLRGRAVEKLRELLGGALQGKTVAVLGLSFKPGTDDLREAPSLEIIQRLSREGAQVRVCDPLVQGERAPAGLPAGTVQAADAYEAAREADAVILVTEWDEFKQLDLPRLREAMTGDVFLDGRNVFDPGTMRALGFRYRGMGRG